jgi:hypothetical protein
MIQQYKDRLSWYVKFRLNKDRENLRQRNKEHTVMSAKF